MKLSIKSLYIVSTPIGNLEDITIRAIETLKNSDLILAEDTRHAKKVLSEYKILTKINSYHLNNEHKKVRDYIQIMTSGKKISLITEDLDIVAVNACSLPPLPIIAIFILIFIYYK